MSRTTGTLWGLGTIILGLTLLYPLGSKAKPGEVEAQLRGFGPQIAQKLGQPVTFAPAVEKISGTAAHLEGYRPQPEPIHAPAGLLPVEQQAWEAMARRQQASAASNELTPFFPKDYSQGSLVHGLGMEIVLKPLGSRAAPAQIENGKLVYHNAYPSTDSLNVVTDGRSEEFLLLRDASAPQTFSYDIAATSGVKDINLSDNTVHFKNAQGQQLQIEAPWLIEAGGKKVTNAVHWQLDFPKGQSQPRLILVVNNAAKLHYPVVIDPTWTGPNGNLNAARYAHTATLLPSGMVLVAGGVNGTTLATAELYDPSTELWTPTGRLNFARFEHTATLLSNGKVLVAGGGDAISGFGIRAAELYDSSTGTWSVTGSVAVALTDSTATLLPNGLVLLAGGIDYNSTPQSKSVAELYNPSTGTWTATAPMINPRFDHTATLLRNGQVLVTGGGSTLAETAACELYNPATGVWTATGNMLARRLEHTATLLPNGQVLVAGGTQPTDGGASTNAAELYDPTSGTWIATGNLNAARRGHTATLLNTGRVLVAGGLGSGSLPSAVNSSAELYDPSTGVWTTTSGMTNARCFPSATLMPSGQVLVAGGVGSTNTVLNTSEIYSFGPVTSTGGFSNTGNLNIPRYRHTSTLLPNGLVLVAGGGDNSGSLAGAELYDPATGVFSTAGSLVTAREEHATVLMTNGKVLVVGGQGNGFSVLASAELYDPTPGSWTSTGSLQTERFAPSASLLLDGRVIVVGGYNYSTGVLASAEIYDSTSGTWTAASNLHTERYGHTSTFLPNGKILVTGGDDNTGTALNTTELFDSTTGTWTVTGTLSVARAGHTATLLPNGLVMVTGGDDTSLNPLTSTELYNSTTGTWTMTGTLTTARANQTATLLSNGLVAVVGGDGISGAVNSAESYNPATGIWTVTGTLTTARSIHAATLLPNGKLLVTGGGDSTGNPTASAELFDYGLGYSPSTQPQITSVSESSPPCFLFLTGTGFTGISEASGGGVNNSSSNIPVVQIESLANEQTFTLPLDTPVAFSPTTLTDSALPLRLPGYVLVTMFVNGTPSTSQILFYNYTYKSQTITFPPIGPVANGQTISLNASASSGSPVTYSVLSGPATISGKNVTFNAVGTVVLAANATASGAYTAAPQVTQTVTVNIASQTVTFPAIANRAYTPVGFALNATASSGLPITYAATGPVKISNDIATLTGVGVVRIRATQSGNANYSAASVLNTFTVTQAAQTITFPAITDKVYPATSSFNLAATSSSGLPVSYTVTSGPATVSGQTVTLTGGGTVVIKADQAGNSSYQAAPSVSQSFKITAINPQTITFPAISDRPFSPTPFALNATASSGLPMTYASTGPVKISNGIATLTGLGTVRIRATQSGNANYSATSVVISFTVTQASQTITFPSVPAQSYGAAPFNLAATATSGLPVTYSLVSGPATLSGTNSTTVTITGVGTVIIQASQTGNTNYGAAPSTSQSFTVNKATQTVTFPVTGDQPFTNTPIPLNATASSGLPITYASTGPVKISNGLATLTGLGTVRIRATQSGDANHNAASVVNTFTVTQGSQTITFPGISTKGYGTPFDLTATASSGSPVTYAITSGPATISGKTVTLTGLGTVVIQASQPGNTNFKAAASVTQSFTVTKGTQTVTFPTISDQPYTPTPFALNATSSTGLPITYSSIGPVKISNGIATLTGTGTVRIRATQSGNANYNATSVVNSFTVTP